MKTISGRCVSVKDISLSKAAKILSNFVSADNGASHVINAYLHRASEAFNELNQLHKELELPHTHKKKHKRERTETGDSWREVENSVWSVDINQELSHGHEKSARINVKFSQEPNDSIGHQTENVGGSDKQKKKKKKQEVESQHDGDNIVEFGEREDDGKLPNGALNAMESGREQDNEGDINPGVGDGKKQKSAKKKHKITVAFDETTTIEDVDKLFKVFAGGKPVPFTAASIAPEVQSAIPSGLARKSPYLTHPIFNTYQTEHELLRYLYKLQSKDLSLCHSMIPLGSCTMKLNATTEMMPVSWPSFTDIHPFAPVDQAQGYQEMFNNLGELLCTITGFDSFSLQPNAGAAGEYAGLMVIRAYHLARGDHHRNVCIIPVSAHGTNPASAAMCGMKIVSVGTDAKGNINIEELRKAAETHKDNLSALMVTYPSTHGVYEEGIDEICKIIHDNGGQVYMDGANMNAQVGLTSPGWIGADVCHLNLHKTFCIPHGGGGPGMGPIGVKKHLAPFLPSHPVVATGGIPAPDKSQPLGTIAAAPWGSALILPISYTYIAMMGSKGLTDASKIAILNANYMAKRLENYYPVLFRGVNGTVAHEFIIDLRGFKQTAGIEAEDVAKRLMDYGFHGPTMSWPVPGTLMIEPTESESKAELDRFCDALISIREEIAEIEKGKADINNNVLKGAPHPPSLLMADAWTKPYSRDYAAFPASWLRGSKFWPSTGRVDNVYGDRNLICTLQPASQAVEEQAAATA